MEELAIVLLNYNGSTDTIECIESLEKSITIYSYNIYIIDNASNKEEVKVLKDYICNKSNFMICAGETFESENPKGNLLILLDENLGFARGNNKVIRKINNHYKYVLLLNNDTIVDSNFIEKMINMLNENSDIGFASCRINNYYNRTLLWNCGGRLMPWGYNQYYSEEELAKMPSTFVTAYITGCALFIRSSIIERYGPLTEAFFHGEEDFNFCWRMKINNIKGMCLNEPLVYHKVSATSSKKGEAPGHAVCHYVMRVVDMKMFYRNEIWQIWRRLLLWALQIKWFKYGYSIDNIRKMKSIYKRTIELDEIDKDITMKIWDLSF